MCSLVYNDFISSRNPIGHQFKYYAKSSQTHSMEALDITKNINSFNTEPPGQTETCNATDIFRQRRFM